MKKKDLSLSMHKLGILEDIICKSSLQALSELLMPMDMMKYKNSHLMTILLRAKDLARLLNLVNDLTPVFHEP